MRCVDILRDRIKIGVGLTAYSFLRQPSVYICSLRVHKVSI